MTAFKGLLIKEAKLMRIWFIWGILLSIAVAAAGYSISQYVNDMIVFEVLVFMILSAHAFYLPIYLLLSLNVEAKTQLWLHNPNSGYLLFFSKFLIGFVFMMVSIFIAFIIAIWATESDIGIYFLAKDQLPKFILTGVSLSIIAYSFYLGIWTFFYWTLYHSLKLYGWNSGFRWGFLIGLWAVSIYIENLIREFPVYQSFWNLGAIDMTSLKTLNYELSKQSFSAELTANPFISLTEIALYLILLMAVVIFSIWMLEKKVEV